jgi:hypothetical protein
VSGKASDGMSTGVHIELADIYKTLLRVERKVDLIENQVTGTNGLVKQVEEHDDRIRAIEANKWPLPAAGAVMALAALGWQIVGTINGQA